MSRENHNDKGFAKIAKQLKKKGVNIEIKGTNVYLYPPNPNDKLYIAHKGHKSYHPIRRWAKNLSTPIKIAV